MRSGFNLKGTLVAPQKPSNIPFNSQWLAGEGAGSWFYIHASEYIYIVTRFSPEGKMECSGLFKISGNVIFDMEKDFEFIHLSHCKNVTIMQGHDLIQLNRIG